MNYKETLDSIADNIENIIIKHNGKVLPTEDYGWVNKRYISDKFRLAHIERYSDKNLEVLHITCFPNEKYSHPIFGFDIICTANKPLAAFMDWSPVNNTLSYKCNYDFEKMYPLPEWAKLIFSPSALGIIPNDNELVKLTDIIHDCFDMYMKILDGAKKSEYHSKYIIVAQNRYCENQQKNERTYNVLKAKLGEDRARQFMETILFPKINLNSL
jgi:phycocyanobilin:ferredoxin oxidoreductase